MANQTITDEYKITGDAKSAVRASQQFENASTKAFKKAGKSAIHYNELLQLGKRAARGVFNEMKRGIGLAREYERTNIMLNIAAGEYSTTLNQQSTALEGITNISDEVIRKMQAQAIALGVNKEEATSWVEAAARMANVTGKSVESAFNSLTMTLGGSAAMLGRVIPAAKDLTAEELKAGGAVKLVNDQFNEFLDLDSRGLTGAIKSIGTEWDNVVESMAIVLTKNEALTESLLGLAGVLKTIARITSEFGGTSGLMAIASMALPGGGEKMAEIAEALDERDQKLREQTDLTNRLSRTLTNIANERSTRELLGADDTGRIGISFGELEIDTGGGKKPKKKGKRRRMGEANADVELFLEDRDAAEAERKKKNSALLDQQLAEDEAREIEVYAGRRDRENEYQTSVRELRESHEIALSEIKLRESERRIAMEAKEAAESERIRRQAFSKVLNITSAFAQASAQALVATLEGDEVAFKKMIKQFLKAQGTMLFGQGIRDSLGGAARVYWGDPGGAALAKLGVAEMIAGGIMIGGSIAVPGVDQASKSGGGGGGLGAGGSGGGSSTFGSQGGESKTVIYVTGGMTNSETIALIQRGEDEANRAGMLR